MNYRLLLTIHNDTTFFEIIDLKDISTNNVNQRKLNLENALGDFIEATKIFDNSKMTRSKIERLSLISNHPFFLNRIKKKDVSLIDEIRLIRPVLIDYLNYCEANNKFDLKFYEEVKNDLDINFFCKRYLYNNFSKQYEETYFLKRLNGEYDNVEENYLFDYECHDLKEVIFALIHFYIINGYKIIKCNHCQKYYATKNLKQKYCKRFSPIVFRKKTYKQCEEAVNYIRNKELKRKINNVKTTLYNLTSGGDTAEYDDFMNQKNNYLDILKELPSVENIEIFQNYLDNVLDLRRKEKDK